MRNQKTLIYTIIAAVLATSLLTAPSIAPAPTSVYVTPKYTYKNVAETFSINVKVGPPTVTNLFAWKIRLSFNPTVINCTAVGIPTDDIFTGRSTESVGPPTINNSQGIVEWLRLLTDPPGVTGSGGLMRVDFKALSIGVSGLTVVGLNTSSYLSDPNNQMMAFTTDSGEVRVTSPGFTANVFQATRNAKTYNVTVISNSTISSFGFDATLNYTNFNATGPNGTNGYSALAIPKVLLADPFVLQVNNIATYYDYSQDASIYLLKFKYSQSTKMIKVLQSIVGDLNGDRKVDIKDISTAARAFGSTPGQPRWNPIADVNRDNIVDMKDVSTVAKNFGKTWP